MRRGEDAVLTIHRIKCDGHGVCASLLPEHIHLDEWGYPIIESSLVEHDTIAAAQRAVDACPVLALRLERMKATKLVRPR
jgi:ferredoxin